MTNEEIRERLFSMQDLKIKAVTEKLTPNEGNIIGIRIPVLALFARELAKGNYQEYLVAPYVTFHEECMLWGLTLGCIKTDIDTLLKYIDKWLPCVRNWAICDCAVSALKQLGEAKNRDIVWNYLKNILKTATNPFAKRFCIVAMFNYFLDDKYIDKVVDIYVNNSDGYHYIRMAIAWGISIILVKKYPLGLKVLKECKMQRWTHNKSIQKANESHRLTAEQKSELKLLKRKLILR